MPPMPPPAGGYGGPGGSGYSVGAAFSYGWRKFQQNLGPIVLAALVLFLGVAALQLIGNLVVRGVDGGASAFSWSDDGFSGSASLSGPALLVNLLFSAISMLVNLVVSAAITKGALELTVGRPLDLAGMFSGIDYVQVVLASIVISVLTTIGLVLCIIPGLAVMFFSWFTMYFIIDKGMPAMAAINASFSFVNGNLGSLVGLFLGSILAYFIGLLLCGVGLLAAIPVVILAQAYSYRTLQGQPVAP